MLFVFMSCSNDETETLVLNNTRLLSQDIEGRAFETGAVIACAANLALSSDVVEIYFYPEANAVNYKLYETNSVDIDPNDYSNFRFLDLEDVPFFNGYLRKFIRPFETEQWLIVSYELNGEIKLSNPIRTKNNTQPTLYSEDIVINQEQLGMPAFSWDVTSEANNAIFFEVLSTLDNGLLSGTYTFDSYFQYYNTSNVVLNITQENPIDLTPGQDYKFTIMDVSEDNWVNEVFITQFTLE